VTRVRWERGRGDLLVCGTWGGERFTLRCLAPEDGAATALDPPVDLGPRGSMPIFDVTADGERVVFDREDVRGDIWLLAASAGRY
jgi:hypothetical protein